MKIQKLIFENINSLYGKWTIDFTHSSFEDGIFAITGNTGSGKTTILDAVCLALYGETPRMGKERCEVISKGKSSLSSELTFEIETGPDRGKYIAFFAASFQKNGKPSGKMPHLLSKDGTIIAEKTTMVQKKINEIIGLTMPQFMQTVLLAQGAFDAFLKAGNDKAAILEEITGTEIYSKISMEVFRCAKEYSDHLDLMQAELNGILLLPQESIQEKQNRIAELQQKNKKLNADLSKIDQLLKYKEQLELQQNDLELNRKNYEKWNLMQNDFQADEQRLEMHMHAIPVTPFYRKWFDLSQVTKHNAEQLSEYEKQLPNLRSLYENCKKNAETSTSQYEDFSKYITSREPLWTQIESLDAEIRPLNDELAKSRQKINEISRKLQTVHAEKGRIDTLLKKADEDLIRYQEYSSLHNKDAALPEYKAKWIELFKNLLLHSANGKKISQKIKSDAKQIVNLKKNLEDRMQELKTLEEKWKNSSLAEEECKKKLQNILNNDSFESLEKLRREQIDNVILRKQILDLSELRAHLINGNECPLCGSTDHPYRKDMPAEPALTEAERRLNETEEKLKLCRKIESDLQNISQVALQLHSKLEKKTTEITFLQTQLQKEEENFASEQNDFLQNENEQKQLRETLEKELLEFNIPYSGETSLPDAVDMRIQKYGQSIQNSDECKNKKQRYEKDSEKIAAQIDEIQQNLKQEQQDFLGRTAMLNQKKEDRAQLFTGDPAQERIDARKKLFELQQKHLKDEKMLSGADTNLKNTEQQISTLTNVLSEKTPEVQNAYTSFLTNCEKNGMTQESYLTACLSEADALKLTQQKTALAEQKKKLDEEKTKIIGEIKQLTTQIPEQTDFEQAVIEREQIKAELMANVSECGAVQKEVETDADNRKRAAGKIAALEEERKQGETLADLNALIGSSTGEKFCRIAQGITLDRLLEMANLELKKMLARYELIRKAADSLDIDVIDHQQGSIIRTSSNLSGGERFLVSLALALGLSSMSGEKIRVQTLFLDEGFGSLDSNTREFALQTLANLQKTEGKMIGIISHVPEVREKINCLIEVTPIGGGRSILSGPGVIHN